jgi:hypothetical protein
VSAVTDAGEAVRVECQVSARWGIYSGDLTQQQQQQQWQSLVFQAVGLPPLGMLRYIVSKNNRSHSDHPHSDSPYSDSPYSDGCTSAQPSPLTAGGNATNDDSGSAGDVTLDSGLFQLQFTPTGGLQSMTLQSTSTSATPAVAIKATARVLAYSSRAGSENAWDFSTDGTHNTHHNCFQHAPRPVYNTCLN